MEQVQSICHTDTIPMEEARGKEISVPSLHKHCLSYLLFASQYLQEVPANMKPCCTYSRQQDELSHSWQYTIYNQED